MPQRHSSTLHTLALTLVLALALAAPGAAQLWNESGDAGQLPQLAQVPVGTGPLVTIDGALGWDFDSDVYCVRLTSTPPAGLPLVMLACVVDNGPNVYLFDANGMGVVTNFRCSGGQKMLLAPNVSLAPGNYYVAVSYTGWDPISSSGAIWQAYPAGQRLPDGPGAANPVWGWGGLPVPAPLNPYSVGLNVNYFTYCDAAVPSARPTWGSLKLRYR